MPSRGVARVERLDLADERRDVGEHDDAGAAVPLSENGGARAIRGDHGGGRPNGEALGGARNPAGQPGAQATTVAVAVELVSVVHEPRLAQPACEPGGGHDVDVVGVV